MKQYKFIGTEQDLIDCGYEKHTPIGTNKERYSKKGKLSSPYENDMIYVYMDEKTIQYGTWKSKDTTTFQTYVGTLSFYYKELDLELIQDLIDKGLVVEVENEK